MFPKIYYYEFEQSKHATHAKEFAVVVPSALITLITSLLGLHAHFSLNMLPEIAVGYTLGMVKIEAFDQLHFIHQAVGVCHTDHNDSIIARIACSFLLN